MKSYYFSFGQAHAHRVNNITLDKDCIVRIHAKNSEEARQKMFDLFGNKWAMQYDEKPVMSYFPRGVFDL